MTRLRGGMLVLIAILSVGSSSTLRAQEQQPRAMRQSGETADAIAKGRLEGEVAGQRVGTGGWFAGGFGSGLLLGLIGTAVIYVSAGNSDISLPAERRLLIATQSPEYQQAFEVGYGEKVKSKRKGSALGGGLLGTATIVLVILTATGSSQ
jgi:hypothetical protein